MAAQINQSVKFKQIDDALADYFQGLNVSNYRENDGVGLFLNYIKTEELDDPELPIEKELGPHCDPYDCAYSWINNDQTIFPIPSYAQIPHREKEAFIFYILQYCYKYNKPPSHHIIQNVLIPKCNGTINNALLPPSNTTTDKEDIPPIAFTGDLSDRKNDIEIEGEASNTSQEIIRLSEEEFKPKYPARAHLNIFTAKDIEKGELDMI
eukprot:31793_1